MILPKRREPSERKATTISEALNDSCFDLPQRETSLSTTYWSESTIIVMIRWTGLAPWELEFHFFR